MHLVDINVCGDFALSSVDYSCIVLAGDAAVGKSSFLMRLCKNEFRGNTSATLGIVGVLLKILA
uniref:Uncharacterized protein n=1 Tax=Malurus cyaneus samueli TaxID=2593467 RepID=A0A8C5XA19_9PASS